MTAGRAIAMLAEHDHGRPYLQCRCGTTFILYDSPLDVERVECCVEEPTAAYYRCEDPMCPYVYAYRDGLAHYHLRERHDEP